MQHSFLVHAAGDAVGVAVTDIAAGATVRGRVQTGDGEVQVHALDAVPLGHKIALRDIAEGEHVVEYGAHIGRATKPIRTGHHVHVHNVKGVRWA